jgi:hypothetical protein
VRLVLHMQCCRRKRERLGDRERRRRGSCPLLDKVEEIYGMEDGVIQVQVVVGVAVAKG